MKKALQSIVLLGAATGVAQAATSVTLYGLVDGGIGYTKTKITESDIVHDGGHRHSGSWSEKRNIGMTNGILNGNRWGLKGSEDLGNGTSAIFQVESGFDLGTGESKQGKRLFGRKAIIGLTGESWGTLTLGRQYNVADDVVSGIDPFGTGVGQAGVADGAFGDSVSARMNNSIKYLSPEFGGFKFGLAYSGTHDKNSSEKRDEKSDKRDTSNWISAGLGFENGPVSVGVSYDRFRTDVRSSGYNYDLDQHKYVDFDTKTSSTTHMWNLFGAYDFEVVKLHLGYGQIRGSVAGKAITEAQAGGIGLNSALAGYTTIFKARSKFNGLNYAEAPGFRQQSWMVGLSAPVGDAGTVLFSYQGNTSKNTNNEYDGMKGKLSIFSVGYVQGLSKRTRVYAAASYGVGKMKFDEKYHRGNVKLKSTLIGVGLQHRF
ncbi:outer membrane porin protein [Advenella mimigardefordensis DPN7]|uniref:Outer membrane porin protein n=2 Tax=Advenella mimigardefordensis TaxID=302406 RepID=W0PFE5_ADVMD|nr:outer membrane porin protein [Advenella mimigardefordensis DPN7]